MAYIKIIPQENYSSLERAIAISEELFNIERPTDSPSDVSRYMFGWIQHPITGEAALDVELGKIIFVYPSKNLNKLVSLFPELSQEEKDALVGFINNVSNFEFRYIIPAYVNLSTREELESEGWFTKD